MFFGHRSQLGKTVESEETSYAHLARVSKSTLTSAATSIDLTGLNSDDDGPYLIMLHWLGTAATSYISLFFNGDTTTTNYYNQVLQAQDSSISGSRANSAIIANKTGTFNSVIPIYVTCRDGYAAAACPINPYTSNATVLTSRIQMMRKTSALSTPAYIDQITLTNNTANDFAIGTICELYKTVNF